MMPILAEMVTTATRRHSRSRQGRGSTDILVRIRYTRHSLDLLTMDRFERFARNSHHGQVLLALNATRR